jgi:hypothetical protein
MSPANDAESESVAAAFWALKSPSRTCSTVKRRWVSSSNILTVSSGLIASGPPSWMVLFWTAALSTQAAAIAATSKKDIQRILFSPEP